MNHFVPSLKKNINVVTMPMRDMLLHYFIKMSFTVGILSCTLLSRMYPWYNSKPIVYFGKISVLFKGALATICLNKNKGKQNGSLQSLLLP